MKKDTILIGLAIGLAVFLIRWFRTFTPIENYELHFLPLFGIYWGLKYHFRQITNSNPEYHPTFLRSCWVGIQMSFFASIFTGVLCLIFVKYSAGTISMFSPLHLHSFPFTSTAAYGLLVSILCSAVYVYFRPVKWHGHTFFSH